MLIDWEVMHDSKGGLFNPFSFSQISIQNGIMKGYYVIKSTDKRPKFSKTVKCNHPLFSAYTVYSKGRIGIGVIQQHFNPTFKYSWWGPVNARLANDIFEFEKFPEWFNRNAKAPGLNSMYPTIEVRKLMYALGMKPLKKERWEASFNSQFFLIL